MRLGCHCHTLTLSRPPRLAQRFRTTPKQFSVALFSSSGKQLKQQTAKISETDKLLYNVKLKTLGDCKLGISRYPDFEYNGNRGSGFGTATLDDSDVQLVSVDFDAEQLYIPPLSSSTTKLLGLPLPPFLRIDIVPEALRGKIDQQSGQVDLELRANFCFSVGMIYKAPPLLVETALTSEETKGKIRGGKGERLGKDGRCRLVGVATVKPVNDLFLDTFLSLPTECLATLNAIISFSN